MQSPESSPQQESFDRIARDLQELREAAGHVSYAELVRRITDLRLRRGIPAAAAIPARSTVYNAFKTGRSRYDTELLRDIVVALGEDDVATDRWLRRSRDARRAKSAVPSAPAPIPVLPSPGSAVPRRVPALALLPLLFGFVVLNHASHWFIAASLDLPVYLDMIGTAAAALAFGPWHGVAVAIATGFTGPIFEEGILAFTLVNITGALVWGYGVHRTRLGRDILSFFFLTLLVATACSFVATPILVVLRGGAYGVIGRIAESLQEAGMPFIVATFTSNISTSVLDKLLTGFIALAIFAGLHTRMRLSAKHMPLIEDLGVLRERPARTSFNTVFAQP
ncbi:hypothetical protein ACFWHT_10950 [Microbacterium sp. NPDC058342]|uniref:hypothetical protein n=1 Tax=Microbacterium sp. NPDC058342 TaxID=3346454 RepID=UPI003663DED5